MNNNKKKKQQQSTNKLHNSTITFHTRGLTPCAFLFIFHFDSFYYDQMTCTKTKKYFR